MKLKHSLGLLGVVVGISAVASVQAKVSVEEIDQLGKGLTAVGADASANKDGSIPAWTGGLPNPPAGFQAGNGYVDPYAGDKPLYTISADNAERYKDKLSVGNLALLKRYPAYKMVVYPTHRSAAYPADVYQKVKAEAAQVEMNAAGTSVVNADVTSVPFPIPKSGVEAIMNHVFRYRGQTLRRTVVEFPVQVNGAFTPVRRQEEMIFKQAMPEQKNVLYMYKTLFTGPSSIAGEALLLQDFIDQVKQPRAAWVYNPGSRRVIRAPDASFDTPRSGLDGLGTIDDYDGFQGSPERYDWKLLGKREMFIPYNSYKIADPAVKYSDIIRPQVINQELVRYELHRVWVVEATLKPGQSHVYGKRVFLLDEDSWQVAHADSYDTRGELWRVFEQFTMNFYDAKATWSAGAVSYDLQSRRYVASAFNNEEPVYQFDKPLKVSEFTPSALRRLGE